jgi:hypothetical protein
MNIYRISLIYAICICSVHPLNSARPFISISGWPQSGTSLIQQILTVTPNVSTMVQGCMAVLGEKCRNINNEGQWLLHSFAHNATRTVSRKELNDAYGPGRMCEAEAHMKDKVNEFLVSTWNSLWSADASIVVQKSPQDMLKINRLRVAFRDAAYQKYIVVLKHPATLNIAVPRNRDWLMRRNHNGGKEALHQREINENFDYFYRLMTKVRSRPGNLTDDDVEPGCSNDSCSCRVSFNQIDLGWLPAMDLLLQSLNRIENSKDYVKILRYEDLLIAPKAVCIRIVQFIFNYSNLSLEQSDPKLLRVCASIGDVDESGVGPSIESGRAVGARRRDPQKHRSLRLRGSSPSLQMYSKVEFSKELGIKSLSERIASFERVVGRVKFKRGSDQVYVEGGFLNSENKNKLMILQSRLKRFGYGLFCDDLSAWNKHVRSKHSQAFDTCYFHFLRHANDTYEENNEITHDAFRPWTI